MAMTRLPLGFNRLETRIVVFFVVLLVAVQVVVLLAIRFVIEESARSSVRQELRLGQRVFAQLLDQNSRQLVEATSMLNYDAAFRSAVTTQNLESLTAALKSHGERIRATGMALIGTQGKIIATTLQDAHAGTAFAFPDLIKAASEKGRAADIRLLGSTAYQIVVVATTAPLPPLSVVMAFVIDDTASLKLQRLTALDVTLIGASPRVPARVLASTVPSLLRARLFQDPSSFGKRPDEITTRRVDNDEYEMLTSTLDHAEDTVIVVVLQRSMREGMAPYEFLVVAMMFLAALSLLVTLIGSIRITRGITRPVLQVSQAAANLAEGKRAAPIEVTRTDEIGQLAASFNTMARGLAERDTMRDLIGKVASPAVAAELLKKKIELGGEERLVTVLFADIRNFAGICEGLKPQESLHLLNLYLTQLGNVVQDYEGVIDKFTGDGLLALFGAPIGHLDDAQRAVKAGLAMCQRIEELSIDLESKWLPHAKISIGINTARVIAGNMGSPTRLNYSVLGDGVNLASRMENLTRRYEVPIIVGEETRRMAPEFIYRELDRVKVKGKQVAVTLLQPLGLEESLEAAALENLERYGGALATFRARRWDPAKALFTAMQTLPDYRRLCEIYLKYIEIFSVAPPPAGWDGSVVLLEK